MIHPSYVELMTVVNEGVEIGEEPVVNSRYSLVIAVAKRAREIAQTAEDNGEILTEKPVNMALKEFQAHKFNIIEPDINE